MDIGKEDNRWSLEELRQGECPNEEKLVNLLREKGRIYQLALRID